MHWRRKWPSTPVFLPGESQGQRSLGGGRLWDRRVGHDCSDLVAAAAAYLSIQLPANAFTLLRLLDGQLLEIKDN